MGGRTSRRGHRGRAQMRGITLVEICAAVVILGILSTVAVVGYKRWINDAHTAEVTSVFNGIATAQEAYKAEAGAYVTISQDLTMGSMYPSASPGAFKTEWGGPCPTCQRPWTTLAFKPDQPVMYGYATIASAPMVVSSTMGAGRVNGSRMHPSGGGGGGPQGTTTAQPGTSTDTATSPVSVTSPYFTVAAAGDVDGNKIYSGALMHSDQPGAIVFTNQDE